MVGLKDVIYGEVTAEQREKCALCGQNGINRHMFTECDKCGMMCSNYTYHKIKELLEEEW